MQSLRLHRPLTHVTGYRGRLLRTIDRLSSAILGGRLPGLGHQPLRFEHRAVTPNLAAIQQPPGLGTIA
jgi:hypothetical protein